MILIFKNCKLIFGTTCQEMDHVNYVRQAIEAASLSYFLEILESNIWKELDVSFFFDVIINVGGA